MDNLDNFLNKANSQMKVKKQEDNKNKKKKGEIMLINGI